MALRDLAGRSYLQQQYSLLFGIEHLTHPLVLHFSTLLSTMSHNDESKRDKLAMLRTMLVQLSGQLQDGHLDLALLQDSFKPGIPPSWVLADYLRRLIQRFHHVYIILDSLDEMSPSRAQEDCTRQNRDDTKLVIYRAASPCYKPQFAQYSEIFELFFRPRSPNEKRRNKQRYWKFHI